MPEQRLTSLLSPNSNLRSKIAGLDSAIDTLKANGMESQAEMLYLNIQQSILNKDIETLKAYGGQLTALNNKNLTVPVEQRSKQGETATSIEQLLSVADSRNVPLPTALVANAANAFANRDEKTLLSLSKSIETMLTDNIQAQTTEKKIPTRLEDGSVILIGETTKTRYDSTGTPIPSGNNNTEIFSGFAEQAFAPTREAMSGIPGLGSVITTEVEGVPVVPVTQAGQIDIAARPGAYSSMERPALGAIEEKEEARKRVRQLYLSGDKNGALDLLNSTGWKGIFGGDFMMSELDEMYKRPPLDEILKPEE